jgi:hypothetical protein
MSVSTLGLSGTSPTQPFNFGGRRGSVSTDRSDSIDESAIDDDDSPGRSAPTTPFARRMSFGAQALGRTTVGRSPGSSGRTPSYTTTSKSTTLPTIPAGNGGVTSSRTQAQASTQSKPRTPSDFPVSARSGEAGFNWSEQLRTRAESSVSQSQRPSFSTSPNVPKPMHERTKSVSEMPAPPVAVPTAPAKPERQKPDAFQERILKGDFYMD